MNTLDLFKRLPHLNDDKKVIKDWGYAPNLYHFDTKWHVSWIHCDDGFGFIDFEGETPEEAIKKAFDWCVEDRLPEVDTMVLVCTTNGKFGISSMYIPKDCYGKVLGDKEWRGSRAMKTAITHWQKIVLPKEKEL